MQKTASTAKAFKRKAGSALAFAADVIAETIWPTRCCICDEPGSVLCEKCEAGLVRIDLAKACPRCGGNFGMLQCTECNDVIMDLQQRKRFPFDNMASAFLVDDASKQIITAFKDHDEHRLCKLISTYMSRYIDPDWVSPRRNGSQTYISFIPATKEALRRRGFDHAELIAKEIARQNSLEVAYIFERPKSSDQRRLNRTERSENMRARFTVRHSDIPKSILLVDDICTTGATLYSAAEAIRERGVDALYGLTFAKVME